MEEKKPNIDERLEALTHSLELLQLEGQGSLEKINRLAEISDRHERDNNRFRAMMRAALEAWLTEGNEEGA